MKEFNILLVGDFLSEQEITTALNSFEGFYHSVTHKHQRKTKLTIVESPQNFPSIKQIIKERKIGAACQLISPENETAVLEVLASSSVMFLPTRSNISKLIPVAFKNKVPILTIATEITKELVDNTCGRIVKGKTIGELEENFTTTLSMLYFDPEARSILSKGSLARFEKEYSWGHTKAMSA